MKSNSMVLLLAGLTLCAFAGCASRARTSAQPTPNVALEQIGSVLALGVAPSGGIPMIYRLTIENPLAHEVTLTAVEVETVGYSGGYHMNRVRHPFAQTIAAGSTRALDFRAWVNVLTEGEMRSVDHPVLLRGIAVFDSPTGKLTRKFMARGNDTEKTRKGKNAHRP